MKEKKKSKLTTHQKTIEKEMEKRKNEMRAIEMNDIQIKAKRQKANEIN